MSDTNCEDCGALFPVPKHGESGASGYAVRENDARICYACADLEERKFMHVASSKTAYVSIDGSRVTTWTGGELGRVVRARAVRVFGHKKINLTIRAFDGTLWTARATTPGMLCTLRKKRA